MTRPLLPAALAFAAGCAVGLETAPFVGALLLLAGVSLFLALGAAPPAAGRVLWAAAFALGAAGAGVEGWSYDANPVARWIAERSPANLKEPVRLRGVVARPSPRDGERHPLLLAVEGLGAREPLPPLSGRLRVEVGGEAAREDLATGDRVELVATLQKPREARSPGAFDGRAWARREGLHGLGYCKSPLLVTHLGRCDDLGPSCLASRVREWARERLRRHVEPGPAQALVRAMVIGDRSALDDETSEAFRRAGTYHVLALSGAQVALVAGLLVALGRRGGLGPAPLALLVSGALAAYALLVGADVPVTRAAATGIVLVLGRALDLDADLANLLALAAVLLLALHPAAVADVSFQLSFGATLAIVLVAPGLLRALPRLPLGLGALLAGSVAAQAALQPLLAYHFHRLAPAALVLNLLAVPLSAGVLLAGAAVLPLSALSPRLGDAAGWLAGTSAHLLLRTCDGGGLVSALDLRTPDPGLLALLPWAFSLRALAGGQWARGVSLSAATGLLLVLGPGTRADGRLEIAVLDVGQGDAIVLRSPAGRAMVVDGGIAREGFDQGERIVAPYLWSHGLRRIDRVVLTHAHPDHAGGLPFLFEAFAPDEIWEGIAPRADGGYERFAESASASGAARLSVSRGTRRSWDGVLLEVLWPPPPSQAPARTRNDDSVVLAVQYGAVCAVLAGDIEAGAEALLRTPVCAVLKVPHHGSRTSTSEDLLRAVRPRLALVSVGGNSPFGHPHEPVLARLRRFGIETLRTDREGTLRVSTDGRRLWIRRGRGGVEERGL